MLDWQYVEIVENLNALVSAENGFRYAQNVESENKY